MHLFISSIKGFGSVQSANIGNNKSRQYLINPNLNSLKMDKFECNKKDISFSALNPEKLATDLNKIVQSAKDSGLVLEVENGFVNHLVQKITQKPYKPLIVAVAGEPASGKTTLANNITETIVKLSDPQTKMISAISCDNYYEDLTKQLKLHGDYTGILNSGYDPHNPSAQDLPLLKRHLSALKSGEDVLIPDYDFASCESVANRIKVPSAKTIIYEGIFALNPIFKDLSDIKIYVDAPSKIIEDRYLKRAISRGKDEAAAKKLLFDLNDSTQKYIASARENANLVINGTSQGEKLVSFINQIHEALK